MQETSSWREVSAQKFVNVNKFLVLKVFYQDTLWHQKIRRIWH